MDLVKKEIIDKKHPLYNECDELSFLSKNLYNSILYVIRQHHFETSKMLNNPYPIIKHLPDYKALPAKVGNQILMLVLKNYKSFFRLKDKGYKNAKIPGYLDKFDGRFIVTYEKGSINKKDFKKTKRIKLSMTNIWLDPHDIPVDSIKQVRIVPRNNQYIIETVYYIKDVEMLEYNDRVAAIDLGVNNLMTVSYNNPDSKPFIINGKPVKSINQYSNKLIAKEQEKIDNHNNRCKEYTNYKKSLNKTKSKQKRRVLKDNLKYKPIQKTNKKSKIYNKRENKLNDYIHKSTRLVVNQLVSNNIHTLVIGYNKGWKQDIKIGKVNNQKFVNIPYMKIKDQLIYKCALKGINVIINEESYTSKCSFLDNEPVKKHKTYKGQRICRGLFRTSSGKLINADLNGSLNILKKAVPKAFNNGIEGLAVNPVRINTNR
ncbi:MAG: transposase [Candidatus Muirbacterium halophilum]|nr:transposase [Candidatus Muirbacterium halophilum]